MPGLALIIDRAGSGPVLDTDAILSAGSLLLIDMSHGLSSAPDGVPAANGYLPNLAAESARAIVGGTAEVRSALRLGTGQNTGYKFERTPKGGLHGAVSQTALAATAGAQLDIPQAILDYWTANPTHRMFASLWVNKTRVSGNTGSSSQPFESGIGLGSPYAAGTYHYAMRSGITRPISTTTPAPGGYLPSTGDGSDVTGMQRRNIGTGGRVGTDVGPLLGNVAQWGRGGIVPSAATPLTAYASFVVYRYYLEDLTVSGRTYAQVDAIDAQLYAQKVTTPGGAYYGDTPTAPATLIA